MIPNQSTPSPRPPCCTLPRRQPGYWTRYGFQPDAWYSWRVAGGTEDDTIKVRDVCTWLAPFWLLRLSSVVALCLLVSVQGRLGETKSYGLHFASRRGTICSRPSLWWRSERGNSSFYECTLGAPGASRPGQAWGWLESLLPSGPLCGLWECCFVGFFKSYGLSVYSLLFPHFLKISKLSNKT